MGEESEPIDLAEELLKVLNVDDPGRAVTQTMELFASYRDAGREDEALDAARKTLTLLDTHVSKLSSGREYKKAAQQMVAAATLFREVLKSNIDANKAYQKASDLLAQAAEEHRIWDDTEGAAAAIAVSCLLGFLGENFDISEKLSVCEAKLKVDPNLNPNISTILKIPYGFATAIQNTDPDWFVWSRDTAHSVLLISPVAKPYEDSVNKAINFLNKRMSDQIKFPTLIPSLDMRRDLIFGEEFQIVIGLDNTGEGVAKDVSFVIELPEEIRLMSGELTSTLEIMEPRQNLEKSLKLICPTGEGRIEIETQIKISVTYGDILGSRQTLPFGPFPIHVRAVRKTDEARENVQKTITHQNSVFEELRTVEFSNPINLVINTFESLVKTYIDETNAQIDAEEFERGEAYLKAASILLDKLTTDFREEIKPQILLENEVKQLVIKTSETIDQLNNQVETTIAKLSAISQKLDSVDVSPPPTNDETPDDQPPTNDESPEDQPPTSSQYY